MTRPRTPAEKQEAALLAAFRRMGARVRFKPLRSVRKPRPPGERPRPGSGGGFSFCAALAQNTIFYIIQPVKELRFRGSSLDDLRKFPALAVRAAGYQMDKIQNGKEPSDWKPMEAIGAGVKEIRIQDEAGAFRVIYLAKLADAVYVLIASRRRRRRPASRTSSWPGNDSRT